MPKSELQSFENLAQSIEEQMRLKTLTHEQLVNELIAVRESESLLIDEMLNRLFPGLRG